MDEKITTVEDHFERTDVEMIKCPLCTKPIRKDGCDRRQAKYPPVYLSRNKIRDRYVNPRMIRCASHEDNEGNSCPYYTGPRGAVAMAGLEEEEE